MAKKKEVKKVMKRKVRETFTFVRGALPSIVWDPDKNKPLAEFVDPITQRVTGVFTTTSKIVADKLREMGYREKKNFPDGVPPAGGFVEIPAKPPGHITPGGPGTGLAREVDLTEG